MRRNVRTLRHVAEVAEVALVDDLPVVLSFDAVELQGGRVVHQVEQRRERRAQADAAAAAVADVEDAPELRLGFRLVPEPGIFPVERMPGRSLERSFALHLLPNRRARRAPSGTCWRGFARPWRASRTSRRSR